MAKRKPVVPGAADPSTESAAVTPPAPSHRRAAPAASTDGELKDLPPKIQEAVAGAQRMSHADAVAAAGRGELKDRVLTEKGWYIPPSAA